MADFAAHADRASAEADARLGDLILYARNGENFAEMKGRVLAAEPAMGWKAPDEAQGGWRLRIAKANVPLPSLNDRIQCAAILGDAEYRPVAKNPIDDGRYWIIALQKV